MNKKQKSNKQTPTPLSLANLSLTDDRNVHLTIPLPPTPPALADTSSQEEKTVSAPETQGINDVFMKQFSNSMSLHNICQYVIHYMTISPHPNLPTLTNLVTLLQRLMQILNFPLPEVPDATPPGKTVSIFTSHLQQMLLQPSTPPLTVSVANIFLTQIQDMLSSYTINDATNGAIKFQSLMSVYS